MAAFRGCTRSRPFRLLGAEEDDAASSSHRDSTVKSMLKSAEGDAWKTGEYISMERVSDFPVVMMLESYDCSLLRE